MEKRTQKRTLIMEKIALDTIREIGYPEEYHVHVVVNQQSPEIHNAVNGEEIGAGDQGIMFGYACVMKVKNICLYQFTMHICWHVN